MITTKKSIQLSRFYLDKYEFCYSQNPLTIMSIIASIV